MSKLVPISAYVSPEERQKLKQLSEATRVSMNDYIREALNDYVFTKYKDKLKQPKPKKETKR